MARAPVSAGVGALPRARSLSPPNLVNFLPLAKNGASVSDDEMGWDEVR